MLAYMPKWESGEQDGRKSKSSLYITDSFYEK